MSWLAKSIVDSLRSDQGNEDDADDDSGGEDSDARSNDGVDPGTPTRGVKEDINELTQTLTRQFWGVASFLAPPPPPSSSSPNPESPSNAAAESPRFAGIRSDLAEIGGKVRSGIAVLSGNMAVTEISKIASTLFASEEGEEDEDEEIEDAVGVTDEVLTFVNNISMHPETWLDFPLLPDDDSNGFYMSDAQQEHAFAVERLAPQLATLKVDLCPSRMSEDYFWKIYFVLVHPRLSNHDAELLSTPQIVQARMMLLPELRNRTKPDSGSPNKDASPEEVAREIIISPSNAPGEAPPLEAHTEEELTIPVPSTELETEKHPIQSNELEIIEKCVIEEESSTKAEKRSDTRAESSNTSITREEEDVDEWLEEETGEAGASGGAIPLGNEEDVSFSDLEDEIEDDGVHVGSSARVLTIDSPSKEEGGWIQLNKNGDGAVRSGDTSSSATKESNDWLDVDIDTV